MELLSGWLYLMALLRLWSVYWGFFSIWGLRKGVFSKTNMTEIHGRTFGTWTLLTCTLCFMCASDLKNKALFNATHLSFVYVLLHFLTEFFIYKTMSVANIITIGTFGGVSTLWMLSWRLSNP